MNKILVLCCIIVNHSIAYEVPNSFVVTDLGTFSGPVNYSEWGINDKGQVIGLHLKADYNPDDELLRNGGGFLCQDYNKNGIIDAPYVTDSGEMINERIHVGVAAGAPAARVMDINYEGVVAGFAYDSEGDPHLARWFASNYLQPILGPEMVDSVIINKAGNILAPVLKKMWESSGIEWDIEDQILMDPESYDILLAHDLNDNGDILLTIAYDPGEYGDIVTEYYIWHPGRDPVNLNVEALGTGAINNAGQAVLLASRETKIYDITIYVPKAVIYDFKARQVIETDTIMSLVKINDNGVVIGFNSSNNTNTPLIWDKDNGMRNLNSLIYTDQGDSSAVITHAIAINNLDQIVCLGIKDNQQHASLLTPKKKLVYLLTAGVNWVPCKGQKDLNGTSGHKVQAAFEEMRKNYETLWQEWFAQNPIEAEQNRISFESTALTFSCNGTENRKKLVDAIKQAGEKLKKDDVFIFHIDTHGGFDYWLGDEPLVWSKVPFAGASFNHYPNTSYEYLALGKSGAEWYISDDDFVNLFRGKANDNTLWSDINKLYIIGACYSGGFWDHDLENLDDKCAFVSAATEAQYGQANPVTGMTYLAERLIRLFQNLVEKNPDGSIKHIYFPDFVAKLGFYNDYDPGTQTAFVVDSNYDFWSELWGLPISSEDFRMEEDIGLSCEAFALSITGNGEYYVSKRGDINRDGAVDFMDLALLAEMWGDFCDSNTWCYGRDLNQNGRIDINDLSVICSYWLSDLSK